MPHPFQTFDRLDVSTYRDTDELPHIESHHHYDDKKVLFLINPVALKHLMIYTTHQPHKMNMADKVNFHILKGLMATTAKCLDPTGASSLQNHMLLFQKYHIRGGQAEMRLALKFLLFSYYYSFNSAFNLNINP